MNHKVFDICDKKTWIETNLSFKDDVGVLLKKGDNKAIDEIEQLHEGVIDSFGINAGSKLFVQMEVNDEDGYETIGFNDLWDRKVEKDMTPGRNRKDMGMKRSNSMSGMKNRYGKG